MSFIKSQLKKIDIFVREVPKFIKKNVTSLYFAMPLFNVGTQFAYMFYDGPILWFFPIYVHPMNLHRATSNHQTLLSYTKLLTSHVNQSRHDKALALFHHMHASLTLDAFAFPLALKSCTALRRSPLGSSIHAHTTKLSFLSNPYVACALVDFYGKSISLAHARKLFDEIPHRTVVVWNAMISLYASSNHVSSAIGLFEIMDVEPNSSSFNSILGVLAELDDGSSKALAFYRRMQLAGIEPNLITVLALLPACVGVAALTMVKEIHGYSIRKGISVDHQLNSGLVEAYGRCGCLWLARNVFEEIPERDVVAWSSMISAYALHGQAKIALSLFQEMELARVRPDEIAFLGVLKACSHAGLVDEALKYFKEMKEVYGIAATSDHYSCLVDVLSRAGRLKEAYGVIRDMPVKATAKAWGAILGACRSYGEVELAGIAGRALFEIDPENAGNYVLLASIYTSAGKFYEAEKVRRAMKEKGVKASPGISWVIHHD